MLKILALSTLLLLPTDAADEPTTTVTYYTSIVYGETDLIINIKSSQEGHTAYLVTFSWEDGDQAETITRLVRRANWAGTGVPARFWVTFSMIHIPSSDPRITRIQVIPVTVHTNQAILLTPGVGGLPQ